jgi:hypothetical protein
MSPHLSIALRFLLTVGTSPAKVCSFKEIVAQVFSIILLFTFDDQNILSDVFKVKICDCAAFKTHHITKFVCKDNHRLQRRIWGDNHCAKAGDGPANYIFLN